jgi:hypothetical protein
MDWCLIMLVVWPTWAPVAYFDGTVPSGTAPMIQRGDKINVSVDV